MMRFSLILIWLGYCSNVWAIGLDISPVHIRLSRSHKIETVQLINLSHQRSSLFQISLYRWRQHGNHNFQEKTQALMVTPPMVDLSPNQRQIIRVGVLRFLPLDHEVAYRLVLRQIPMHHQEKGSGLRMLLATKLPIFVEPCPLPKPTFHHLTWHLHFNNKHLVLTVENHNKKHIQVNEVDLLNKQDQHIRFKIPTFVYVLAGQSHTWRISDKQFDIAADQWVLRAKANIGHEKMDLSLQKI